MEALAEAVLISEIGIGYSGCNAPCCPGCGFPQAIRWRRFTGFGTAARRELSKLREHFSRLLVCWLTEVTYHKYVVSCPMGGYLTNRSK